MRKVALLVMLMVAIPVFSLSTPAHSGQDRIQAIIEAVDTDELYRYDRTIQDFGPHPTGSEACRAVASFIYDEFQSYGLEVSYEPWEAAGLSSRNVVATLPGETNFTVIISAHYDSVEVSPGADDDGSGVSCVLMAARILSQYQFRHTIRFVAFSGEEQGLYGSAHHARQAYLADEYILADLQLDGVGHAESSQGGSTIRLCAEGASTWITDVAQEVLDIYGQNIDLSIHRNRNFPGSDHQSFLNYGYEGVFFLEYEFNPYYHSAQDTIEHVNFSYLTKVCKLATATLATIADREVSIYLRLVEPERGALYLGSRKLMVLDSHRTMVLGQTLARAQIYTQEDISRVEFYFDGRLRGIAEGQPYEHTYTKLSLFNHVVTAVAHGRQSQDSNELTVAMYNLAPGNWLD